VFTARYGPTLNAIEANLSLRFQVSICDGYLGVV
jgi:hypothetical protein